MMYFGFLLMPLAVTFRRESGRSRRLMAGYTAIVAALGLPMLSLGLLGDASPWRDVDRAAELFRYSLYGSVFSTWVSAFLHSHDSAG